MVRNGHGTKWVFTWYEMDSTKWTWYETTSYRLYLSHSLITSCSGSGEKEMEVKNRNMKYANIDNEIRTITGYSWLSYFLTCSIDHKSRWYCIRNDTNFVNGLNEKRRVGVSKRSTSCIFCTLWCCCLQCRNVTEKHIRSLYGWLLQWLESNGWPFRLSQLYKWFVLVGIHNVYMSV